MNNTKISSAEITRLKGMGFLLNRGTNLFSGRIVSAGGVYTAEQLNTIAECSKKFGNGKIAFTSRLDPEIVGIPYEKIDEASALLKECGLSFGGTGAKIRPVVACKGTTCVYGNYDTQALAKEIHERYYVGWGDVKLPHKFKIAVGGCPNSCMKPSLNDFGVEGHRFPQYDREKCHSCKSCFVAAACPMKAAIIDSEGKLSIQKDLCAACGVCNGKCPFKAVAHHNHVKFKVFVGGTWGKKTRNGTPLSRLVEAEEIYPLLEKTILWFKKYAYQKERLGAAIDRIGVDKLEEELFSDTLLQEKEKILAEDIKTRP